MKRSDRIKLAFTRNWDFPGKERLGRWSNPSGDSKIVNGITWFKNEDIAIYASSDNYIESAILTNGTYEDEIGKLIRISLKPGDCALDIGANIGIQSIRMAQCAGNEGKVFAFEPLEYLQQKFKNNVTLNGCNNVILMPFALSDQEGQTNFAINPDSWNQGTFSLNGNHTGEKTQTVTIKIADNIPEVQQIDRLSLVKIDVEGYEYNVLQGLKLTLAKHKPRIIFEYDSNYWQSTGQSMGDCYMFLKQLNYTLYQISQIGCELINSAAEAVSGNIFCVANN